MEVERCEIRLALPSKGPLSEPALALLENAGLHVHKPNPRQYQASLPALPGVVVLFQRPGDIVVSVRDGSVDFGITGGDMLVERVGDNHAVLAIHPALGFGQCTLNVITPENWMDVEQMSDLHGVQSRLGRSLRVATKFPNLTRSFFTRYGLPQVKLVPAEGTLEIAPTIGYADLITDLVSTGTTLRDNRLKKLGDGQILASQSTLIANRASLRRRPEVLAVARQLLEFIVAHLRATETVHIFANMRGDNPQAIAQRMFTQSAIGGLQGPTLSPVITRQGEAWYAVNLIVRRAQLVQAIAELRQVGGSGVVVTPVTYIFEEEPLEYQNMLKMLEE
ncbi:MAG: ATP phosphoribosyltransferase [Anaerolineales bacterium]|nr:ATP phosphoribosyltransferase [Anaerolineales bacterium]